MSEDTIRRHLRERIADAVTAAGAAGATVLVLAEALGSQPLQVSQGARALLNRAAIFGAKKSGAWVLFATREMRDAWATQQEKVVVSQKYAVVKQRPSHAAPVIPPSRSLVNGEIVVPSNVKYTIAPAWTHDPRYQVGPTEKVLGAGFGLAGPGRDVQTGRAWK